MRTRRFFPVTLLTGPPGAGKSTYALSLECPHVVDIDLIPRSVPQSERLRLRRLQVEELPRTGGIFMTAAPTRKQKAHWVRVLSEAGAPQVSVVVLMPPKHVAYERMRSREASVDPHSYGVRIDELVKGIDHWYMRYEPYVGEEVRRD